MKKNNKINLIIPILFLLCLIFFLSSIISFFCKFSYQNDYFLFQDASRLVRTQNNIPLLTKELIEEEVEKAGGWGSVCSVKRITIETIQGRKLNQPLTIVKKDSREAYIVNLIAKLLDDFFYVLSSEDIAVSIMGCDINDPFYQWRMDRGEFDYDFQHVPYPIAEYEEGYYYVYFEGGEGVPYRFGSRDAQIHIDFKEFELFSNLMKKAGFKFSGDVTDIHDEVSKNVVFAGDWKEHVMSVEGPELVLLPSTWQRIDFEQNSISIIKDETDYRILGFLSQHKDLIKERIGEYKYRLLELSIKRFDAKEELNYSEKMEFNNLLYGYQQEALQDYLP